MSFERTSWQGGQPLQQRRLHWCRPQLRVLWHRRSQRRGSQHDSSFLRRPQRQVLLTSARHSAGQAPTWHRSAQVCSPQASSLPQVSPQTGVGSSHCNSVKVACIPPLDTSERSLSLVIYFFTTDKLRPVKVRDCPPTVMKTYAVKLQKDFIQILDHFK